MKNLLIALLISTFVFSGAEAQYCKCKCHNVAKHKLVTHKATVQAVNVTTTAVACRVVPFEACSINADGKSVSCYKTTDPEGLTPMNDARTYYGATGNMPGEVDQPTVKTIIIPAGQKGNYCVRHDDLKETVCSYDNVRLVRDDFGYYHYR